MTGQAGIVVDIFYDGIFYVYGDDIDAILFYPFFPLRQMEVKADQCFAVFIVIDGLIIFAGVDDQLTGLGF